MALTAALWRAAKFPQPGVQIAAHNSMAAMLRAEPGDAFALAPFAPVLIDGRWCIAACQDAIDGEPVLIDGKTGAMQFGEDAEAVGFWGNANVYGERLKVYSNGILLARDWVAARIETLRRKKLLGTAPDEQLAYGDMPGLAMIGEPSRIGNFSDLMCAGTVEIDNPRLRHVLADAMLRSARLPAVVSAPARLKVVADNGRLGR
jgi:hypothetical protein